MSVAGDRAAARSAVAVRTGPGRGRAAGAARAGRAAAARDRSTIGTGVALVRAAGTVGARTGTRRVPTVTTRASATTGARPSGLGERRTGNGHCQCQTQGGIRGLKEFHRRFSTLIRHATAARRPRQCGPCFARRFPPMGQKFTICNDSCFRPCACHRAAVTSPP